MVVNHKTVSKLTQAQGLYELPGSGKTFRRTANMATAADLVEPLRPASTGPAVGG